MLCFAVFVVFEIQIRQGNTRVCFLIVVFRGGSHRFGQIFYAKILVLINAGDFRESVIDLVSIVLVFLVIQHLVELFGDGVAVGFGAVVVGGKMHLGAERHLIIIGFFNNLFEVLLGLRLLSEVFIEFTENELQTCAELLFRFVVKRIADIIYGFLHVSVGGSEVIFRLSSVKENSKFLLVLLLVHIADGFQQLVGTGIVALPHLGAGQQHFSLVSDVRLRVGVYDVVQHALRLYVILLVKIGFGHQEIGIINSFDVFLALNHH